MYVIQRTTGAGRKTTEEYIGHDEVGSLIWTTSLLEAARFTHPTEVKQCGCREYLRMDGVSMAPVGFNGHVVIYLDRELQIYREGRTWRCRYRQAGLDGAGQPHPYTTGRKGSTTPKECLRYGRQMIKSEGVSHGVG